LIIRDGQYMFDLFYVDLRVFAVLRFTTTFWHCSSKYFEVLKGIRIRTESLTLRECDSNWTAGKNLAHTSIKQAYGTRILNCNRPLRAQKQTTPSLKAYCIPSLVQTSKTRISVFVAIQSTFPMAQPYGHAGCARFKFWPTSKTRGALSYERMPRRCCWRARNTTCTKSLFQSFLHCLLSFCLWQRHYWHSLSPKENMVWKHFLSSQRKTLFSWRAFSSAHHN
jgi:hypothetical protein